MFLRLIPYRTYARLIFSYRARDLLEFFPTILKDVFLPLDSNLFQVEGRLQKLNDLLFQYKEHFSRELGSASAPFAILITKERERSLASLGMTGGRLEMTGGIKKPLRPGKVYIEEGLKDKVEEELKGVNLHFRLEKWGELFELKLPATFEQKLYFPLKDFFLIPNDKRCFFCGSYQHATSDCPGLNDREPQQTFYRLLTLSPWTIADELSKAIFEEENTEALNYFYTRYFFNFPAFLKMIFYRTGEINSFSQVPLHLPTPVRGGGLGLGLEELMAGRVETAEKRFSEVEEGDFRRELGLAFVQILKEDFPKAIYFIENALSLVNNPFVRGYLNYLKGAIYFQLGDKGLAEESFKEAMKEDSTNSPSFFFLGLIRYLEEEPLDKLSPFFHHPYTLYLSYLEPLFLRVEKELEELLDKVYLSYKEEALTRLKEAEDKYHALKEVMPDETSQSYLERLKKLSQDINQGGLALVDSASKQVLELTLELNGYVFSRIKKLKQEFEPLRFTFRKLSEFWTIYPYKTEDAFFGQSLKKAEGLILRIERRLKRSEPNKELKFLESEFKQLKDILENLQRAKPELERKWEFRKRLYSFIKKFSLAEGLNLIFHVALLFLPEVETSWFPSLGSFVVSSLFILVLVLISVLFIEKKG
jgi:tetratricopeptide (TPR) repeat protein